MGRGVGVGVGVNVGSGDGGGGDGAKGVGRAVGGGTGAGVGASGGSGTPVVIGTGVGIGMAVTVLTRAFADSGAGVGAGRGKTVAVGTPDEFETSAGTGVCGSVGSGCNSVGRASPCVGEPLANGSGAGTVNDGRTSFRIGGPTLATVWTGSREPELTRLGGTEVRHGETGVDVSPGRSWSVGALGAKGTASRWPPSHDRPEAMNPAQTNPVVSVPTDSRTTANKSLRDFWELYTFLAKFLGFRRPTG